MATAEWRNIIRDPTIANRFYKPLLECLASPHGENPNHHQYCGSIKTTYPKTTTAVNTDYA